MVDDTKEAVKLSGETENDEIDPVLNEKEVAAVSGQSKQDDNQEIDQLLNDLGGGYNRLQRFNYCLMCVPIFLAGALGIGYIFTTLDLDFR